jgi:dipeptidyl aminopeptidase/acylaminoacyl peptidase
VTSTAADIPLIPRAHLFGNPQRTAVHISPDGRSLSWLAPVNGVLNIWVAPIDDLTRARAVTNDTKRGIPAHGWTYDGQLFYQQDVDGNEDFHLYVVDLDAGTARNLTPFKGVTVHVERVSKIVRDRILVAMNQRDPKYFDLHTLNLATGELVLVEQNTDFAGFITDRNYRAHFATRAAGDGTNVVFKRNAEGTWTEWTRFAPTDAWTSGPRHLNADGSALFMCDSRGRDTAALTRIDLASGATQVVAADPRVDLFDFILDADTLEPVAYSVDVERPEYVALTTEIQRDLDFLNGKELGDWHMGGRTEDERLWIINADSDLRPATTYLYDREHQTLRTLFEHRPELNGAPLVPMQPVVIPSRDGFELISYLSRPAGANQPGPLALLVHGGPWGRDGFGFNSEHQWLANRGYSVLSVNFRGSMGFGKTFVNAGDGEWGRRMDDDLLDAVAWAVDNGIADPSRVAIMGGSYGGYAVLASMTRNPEVYACGVAIVGPSNLETLLASIPSYWESFRTQFIRAIGNPSTEEGRALLRERSPVHLADRIRRPLLIGQGANDPRVKRAESDQMADAMKANGIPVTYVLYPDEGHGFARPENSISFNAIAEAFLERHLGGRAEPMRETEWNGSTAEILEGAELLDLPARHAAQGV